MGTERRFENCIVRRANDQSETVGTMNPFPLPTQRAILTGIQRPLTTTEEAAIAALRRIDKSDPEVAHSKAEKVLLSVVHPDVKRAHERLVGRCDWWAWS